MSHTTKALVSKVKGDKVRDQGTKAKSVRNLQTKPRNRKLGKELKKLKNELDHANLKTWQTERFRAGVSF